MAKLLLSAESLSKSYPVITKGRDRTRALWDLLRGREVGKRIEVLRDISLKVQAGSSLALVGENGAGKSTLLKIVTGVIKPTTGRVTVNGNVGALLELGAGFHPDHTGRENLYLAGALMGLSRQDVKRKMEAIQDFSEIGRYMDEPVKHYSSGMVVRLGFALVAATSPDLLITDEVLAVGDESFQRKCIRWMEAYLENGGTLLMVSHSMYHVQKLCSQAIWLHDGSMRQYGDPNEVTQAYLAYHEKKRAAAKAEESEAGLRPNHDYEVLECWLNGEVQASVTEGSDLVVEGVVFSRDQREPKVAFGVLRADGTAVYTTTNVHAGVALTPIAKDRYRFRLELPDLQLLPGHYEFRLHVMDPEAMRLYPPLSRSLIIKGETLDYGLVRLQHRWLKADQE